MNFTDFLSGLTMRKLLFCLLALPFVLSGCLKPYVPDVQQGNVLSQSQMQQIRIGMSKEEVQFILGTPIITENLTSDRWDYIYTLKPGKGKLQEKRLTLYFSNEKLAQIQSEWPDTDSKIKP